jgi:uncharacterized Fe-S cluster protein YjdI
MQEYRNDDIIVRFEPKVCIHSGNCVRGLPAVFDVRRRAWVDVNAASAAAIAAQVAQCPSGALTIEWPGGGR